MASSIHPSRSCLLHFYTIPLKSKDIFYNARNIILLRLFIVTCCVYVMSELYVYTCTPTLIATMIIWAGYRHFEERLPEATSCLQTGKP